MLQTRFIKSIIATSKTERIQMPWTTTPARSMRVAKLERDLNRSIDSLAKELGQLVTYSHKLDARAQESLMA